MAELGQCFPGPPHRSGPGSHTCCISLQGITIVFFVAFNVIQAFLAEKLDHGAGAPAINVFAKENKERKALNEKLQANKERYRKGEVEQDLSDLIQTRKPFTWQDLT